MKIIGLTGGIGSGKSTVAGLMKENFNAYVLIADDIAKKLMEKNNISYKLAVEYFGREILSDNDEIDRKKLGEIVFRDSNNLKKINSFSHPYVRKYILDKIEKCKKTGKYNYVVVETALILESGYKEFCDEVWYVNVSEAVRRERLKSNRGYTDKKIDDIIKNQLSDEEFVKLCDAVIYNNSNMEYLIDTIKKLLVK